MEMHDCCGECCQDGLTWCCNPNKNNDFIPAEENEGPRNGRGILDDYWRTNIISTLDKK